MNSELPADISQYINRALKEDIGSGDVTTDTIVPANAVLRGRIVAKENGVVAGFGIARQVMLSLDHGIEFVAKVEEGTKVERGTVLVELEGPARALLTGERIALNFLGR